MCGIAGFLSSSGFSSIDATKNRLLRMSRSLLHRGPDSHNIWIDEHDSIALAHQRLSIVDLSPSGAQPMRSPCSRYVISFNGEIYNWHEIRSQLRRSGYSLPWQSNSDTEALLSAISHWGLIDSLNRIRGMFAFALWDSYTKNLTLVRDRIGEKPLYYGQLGDCFVFASELKSIQAFSANSLHLNSSAISSLLRFGYIGSPHSIYNEIFKLPPGSLVTINKSGISSPPSTWWSYAERLEHASHNQLSLTDREAISHLDKVLSSAVSEQMLADVPIGAFLSGGIDSSTIVSLMQQQSNKKIKTFTIGFSESEYDEAHFAKDVAHHLNTDHTELIVTPQDALDLIPSLPHIYDEPFADSSQLPTALISSLTSQHVKVSLSGDAGDELFGGYNRYFLTSSLWSFLSRLPTSLRKLLSRSISSAPSSYINKVLSLLYPLLPPAFQSSNPLAKLQKVAEVMHANSQQELYYLLVSQWKGKLPLYSSLIPNSSSLIQDPASWPTSLRFEQQMMAVDTLTYLPDDILVKVDRAAMFYSLETRVPFLDSRVIDFSSRLPFTQKVRHSQGKWILRQLLYKYIPEHLVNRPKQGFAVPIDHWLRGPLREWAEHLLSVPSLTSDNIFDPVPIRKAWQLHISGHNTHYSLWPILMYQAWRFK